MPRVAVLGATGHTGRLTVDALLARGASVVACGRSKDTPAPHPAVPTRVVDVRDAIAVRDAVRDVDAVVNLAGPFLSTGQVPIEEAIARGIPYADTTGEQLFMLQARHRHDAAARKAGVAIVNALAFEYAFSDLATAAHFPEGGRALHVLYRPRRAQGSAGTKKTVVRVLASQAHGHENGALVKQNPGDHTHRFGTLDGWRDGVSFPGGEILTIPSHTPFRTVRTYVPGPPSRARTARRVAPLARAVLRGPLMRAAEMAIDAGHKTPENDEARGEIYLHAEGGSAKATTESRWLLVRTPDPYLATAEILAEGILRLMRAPGSGVLAPAQALDAHATLAALRARMPSFDLQRVQVLPEGVVRASADDDKII